MSSKSGKTTDSSPWEADSRFEKAAKIRADLGDYMSIGAVMQSQGFSKEEAEDMTKHQRVRRMAAKLNPKYFLVLKEVQVNQEKGENDDVSPITDPTEIAKAASKRLLSASSETTIDTRNSPAKKKKTPKSKLNLKVTRETPYQYNVERINERREQLNKNNATNKFKFFNILLNQLSIPRHRLSCLHFL